MDHLFSIRVAPPSTRKGMKNYNLAYTAGTQIARSLKLDDIVEAIDRELHARVAQTAVDHTFVHAAVVGWRGRAIVIPGRSMAGKSTLSKALVDAGATYYSDEFAAVTTKGLVRPYLKPLSLRGEDGTAKRLDPSMLGQTRVPPPIPVGSVVLTRYEKGNSSYRPREIPAGQAAFELFQNTIMIMAQPARDLAALSRMVEGAKTLKGPRGEASEAAIRLLGQL